MDAGRRQDLDDVGVENSSAARDGAGSAFNVHVDHHDVEFDPTDQNHILIGNDGGVYETYDSGKTWRFFANLPITQFYRVGDRQRGAVLHGLRRHAGQLLDVRSVAHDAHARHAHQRLVHGERRRRLPGAARPEGSEHRLRESQSGGLVRFDRRTGRTTGLNPTRAAAVAVRRFDAENLRSVRRFSAGQQQRRRQGGRPPVRGAGGGGWRRGGGGGGGGDRVNWDAPYIISPHSNTRLYWASQFVYRTDDRGDEVDAHQPGSVAQPARQRLPIMGKVWPHGLDRAPRVYDAALEHRLDRRVAAARRADRRRHR